MSETKSLISKTLEPFRSILIFGPPGSGKGTIGKFLDAASNHYHLSSGDIFRGLSPESPAGQLYHSYASKGHLVPDEATVEIWYNYVQGLIATNKYFPSQQFLLLDGLPRTQNQAKLLEKYLKIEHIIVLDVEEPKRLIERMQRRALIEKRKDDLDVEVLKTRLQVYSNDTKKVLDHYDSDLVTVFDANQKPLEVLRDILIEHSDIL